VDSTLAIFPSFIAEIVSGLEAAGRQDLAEQLRTSKIRTTSFDNSADAGYIAVEPGRELNVVEQNIIGVRHGGTISVECKYWVNLDVDNFGRLLGVEVLSPPADVKSELRRRSAA